MLIECEQCSAKYKITIKKSSGKAVRFKCGKCGNMIIIQPGAPAPAPAGLPSKIPVNKAEAAPVKLPTKIPATAAARDAKATLQVTCIKCGTGFVKQARDKSRLCYQCRIDSIVAKKRAQTAAEPAEHKIEEHAQHKYTIRNADGLVLGPIKLRTITVLVREKRVTGNEEAKKDDEPFKPLLEIPELAQLFPDLKSRPKKEKAKEEKPEEAAAPEGEEVEEEIDIPLDEEGLGAALEDEEKPGEKVEAARAEPEPEPAAEDEEDLGAAVVDMEEIPLSEPEAGKKEEPAPSPVSEEGEEDEESWAALDEKVKKVEEILAREGIKAFQEEPEAEESEPGEAEAEPGEIEEEEKEEEEGVPAPEEEKRKKEGILGRIMPFRVLKERAMPDKDEEEELEELDEGIEELDEEIEELEELTDEVEEEDIRYTVRYSDGMVLGPVKLSTVRDLFDAGNMTGQEEIQKEGYDWIPVTECEGLKDLFASGDDIDEDEVIELTEMMEEVD